MPHTAKKMPNLVPISTSLLTIGALVFAATCYSTATVPHGGPDYFVRPSLQSACPSNASAQQHCMTLDAYAKNTSQFLGRDVRLIFLGGVHILSRELNLSRVENVQLVAANTMREFFNHSNARIEVVNADMIFHSVGSLSMENLTITGASILLDNTPKRSADIRGVKFMKTSLLQRYREEVITPDPEPEPGEGGDPDEAPDGGPDDNNMVDDFQYSNTSLHPAHLNIRIENSILEHSGGTGLQIIDKRLHGDLKIDIQNTSVSHHMQGGIIIESTTKLHFTITDSVVEGNMVSAGGGRKNIYSAAAGLGIYSNRPDGARVTIRGTRFTNNRDFRGMPMVMWVSRAQKVEVENSNFLDNLGTAIRAANIKDTLRFRGNVTFRNNIARNGGALALVSTIIDIMPESNVTFEGNHANNVGGAIFVESTSMMYEENNPNTLVPCFYRFPEMNREMNRDDSGDNNNIMYTLRNLTFGNNSAFGGGHGIYGASLRSYCLVDKVGGPKHETPIRSGDQLARAAFLFNETTDEHMSSLVSSQPSRVCVLNDKDSEKSFSESCATASQIFVKLTAYPGEEFSLKVVLVGAEFGTGTGEVFAQFLPVHESEPRLLSQHQSSQKVRGHLNSPKTLTYSVFSRNSYEILVLTTNPDPVSFYGDEEQMMEDIENYNYSSIIPVGLLTTPIYINVTLSKCPSGFFLDSNSMGCKCNPQVCNEAEGGEKATERGGGLLYFGEKLWVNAYDDGQVNGIILHYNCPYDYCKSSSNGIDLSNPDTQCAMDHAGILCGKCDPGYSMALGSDKCLPCSDNNISLLLFFGLAGFLLVFVLHIFNITVTWGTLSGLLFYANIMWAYRSIFFAHHENWFLKTFVAWLNLDFGIEACFSKGLTAYGKTWMQYMFPLYVWIIAGGIMLFSYSTEKLAKHYGGKRSVQILVKIANFFGNNSSQVMATLFILSYAKLLRTSIIALVPAHLYVYTDSGERIDALTTTVWSYDGNLVYGHLPHIFLLVVALVVIVFLLVPYTALLLFVQPIKMAAARCRCLKWINKTRPFFDAYTGPLNPLTQFWVGLLLLARFILLLTFIVTYASDPSVSLVAMVITVVLLLAILTCTGPLYNDPVKTYVRFPDVISFQSIMEIAFLLNLVIIGVSTLSVDFVTGDVHTKASILYISVIIAFFQFVLILLYHLWTILMKKTCSGSDASTSGGFIKTKRGGYQNLEAENAAGFWPTLSIKKIDATETGEEDKLQKSKLEAINGDANASSSTLVTSSSKVANGGKSVEYSTTSCDASELSKPVFVESTTTDKEPPTSYDSSQVCKPKLTDSIVKKDLLASLTTSSPSEQDLRKPMLTDSGSDKDQHSSYDSLELRKPLLTDSNLA